MRQINLTNNKGMTLLELTVSILISSIIISMLLSLLTMALNSKANLDVQNRMANESTFITEIIRNNLLKEDFQFFEIITDNDTEIILKISKVYEVGLNEGIVDVTPLDSPLIDGIKFDKVKGAIYYSEDDLEFTEDDRITSENIFISEISELESIFEVVELKTVRCLENSAYCSDAIIKLNFSMEIIMDNGTRLTAREFRSSIIV